MILALAIFRVLPLALMEEAIWFVAGSVFTLAALVVAARYVFHEHFDQD